MKGRKFHLPNPSYIAAFVIGVILFTLFWKALFGASSNIVVLAGMAGVVVAVIVFWVWNEIRGRDHKDQ
jgi:hypothetical protein